MANYLGDAARSYSPYRRRPRKYTAHKPYKPKVVKPKPQGIAKPTRPKPSGSLRQGPGTSAYRRHYAKRPRGFSQSTARVKKHGLIWGGQRFRTKKGLSKYLGKRGVSYSQFAKRHRSAAAGLRGKRRRRR